MKKSLVIILLASLAVSANAATPQAAQPAKRESGRRHRMQLPVYASAEQFKHTRAKPAEITPEMRSKFEAARKRRFEIMILIGAYKIMPESERAALKRELLKRIDADFQAMIVDQKERIAKAEADLERFRNELKNRESRRQELIESELDRLLKMPAYGSRRGKRPEKQK